MKPRRLATIVTKWILHKLRAASWQSKDNIQFFSLDGEGINFTVCREPFHTHVVCGSASPQLREIFVEIRIPFGSTKLHDIHGMLKALLRHEITHCRQYANGTLNISKRTRLDRVWNTQKDLVNYFSDPSEIEAYVVTIRQLARTMKLDFDEALRFWWDNNASVVLRDIKGAKQTVIDRTFRRIAPIFQEMHESYLGMVMAEGGKRKCTS